MRGITSGVVALSSLAVMVLACSPTTTSPPAPTGTGPLVSSAAPSQVAVAGTATTTPKPSTTPGPGDVVYNGRIDIGGGRAMEVRCVGVGTPTVLLEGGGITPSFDEYPSAFVNDLGKTTTACHYSRAGGGGSSAPAGTRTMAGTVDDAYAMLAALEQEANVKGPFVFVGWSFGGSVALAEALEHPEKTAGLVILDTDFVTDFIPTCIADGRTKADCQAEYDGDVEAKSMEHELIDSIKPLPDIPIKIVNAMVLADCVNVKGKQVEANISGTTLTAPDCASLAARIADLGLKGWLTLGKQVAQTRVEASHDSLIQEAGPQVSAVILATIAEARSKP